jgi:hypothetical protein
LSTSRSLPYSAGHVQLPNRVLLLCSPCASCHQVSCTASLVVPGAHQVVGPSTHRGSGPREVHTTGRGSYNLPRGRDWIHANCCIPSTMHQCIIQWIGDSIEMVKGETSLTVAATEAHGWIYDRVSCISGKA